MQPESQRYAGAGEIEVTAASQTTKQEICAESGKKPGQHPAHP